jgi:hypothetical protein
MVNIKIMLHNFSHMLVPFIIIYIGEFYFPQIDFKKLLFVSVIGSFFPDIDHLNMKKNYKHLSFWKFIKEVMKAERYRRAFLFFHNYLTMLITGVISVIFVLINVYITLFLLAFLTHLFLDYLADLMIIKTHSHWKFRRWL